MMLPFLLHRFSQWWAAEPTPNFGPIAGYTAKELQIGLLHCLLLLTRRLWGQELSRKQLMVAVGFFTLEEISPLLLSQNSSRSGILFGRYDCYRMFQISTSEHLPPQALTRPSRHMIVLWWELRVLRQLSLFGETAPLQDASSSFGLRLEIGAGLQIVWRRGVWTIRFNAPFVIKGMKRCNIFWFLVSSLGKCGLGFSP
jgi:hypothetical protein